MEKEALFVQFLSIAQAALSLTKSPYFAASALWGFCTHSFQGMETKLARRLKHAGRKFPHQSRTWLTSPTVALEQQGSQHGYMPSLPSDSLNYLRSFRLH